MIAQRFWLVRCFLAKRDNLQRLTIGFLRRIFLGLQAYLPPQLQVVFTNPLRVHGHPTLSPSGLYKGIRASVDHRTALTLLITGAGCLPRRFEFASISSPRCEPRRTGPLTRSQKPVPTISFYTEDDDEEYYGCMYPPIEPLPPSPVDRLKAVRDSLFPPHVFLPAAHSNHFHTSSSLAPLSSSSSSMQQQQLQQQPQPRQVLGQLAQPRLVFSNILTESNQSNQSISALSSNSLGIGLSGNSQNSQNSGPLQSSPFSFPSLVVGNVVSGLGGGSPKPKYTAGGIFSASASGTSTSGGTGGGGPLNVGLELGKGPLWEELKNWNTTAV